MAHADGIRAAQDNVTNQYVDDQIDLATDSIQNELDAVQAQVTTLDAEIVALNEQLDECDETITDLENGITSRDTQISTLNGSITALTADNDTLTAEKAALTAANSTLTSEKAALTAANNTLTSDKAALQAQVSTLQSQKTALEAQIVSLQAEIVELEERIEELENQSDPAVLPYWGAPAWRDEFDGTTIDTAKWNVWDRSTLGLLQDTGEVKSSACSIVNGNLRIRALWKNPPTNEGPKGILTHTTGYVSHIRPNGTRVYEQKYGRWEIRAKVPTGPNTRGTLPAFWLRNTKTGEIDIMEAWGYGGTMSSTYNTYTKDTATTTIHSSTTGGTVNGKPYRKMFWRYYEQGVPRTIPTGFHTYAFEYTPTYMALIVDGVERRRVTPTSPDPVNGGTLAWLWDTDFFDAPLHVRLNLHIGPDATYWGQPDPAHPEYSADPMDYEIEYVRIWAMPA